MSEIEKLYKKAGVYDFRYDCDVSFADGDFGRITNCTKGEVKDYCTDKKYFKSAKVIIVKHLYPPFTPEKQLSLIKLLGSIKDFSFEAEKFKGVYYVGCRESGSNDKYWGSHHLFEEALAELINQLWQDLTEQERIEIRRYWNEFYTTKSVLSYCKKRTYLYMVWREN